MRERRAVLTSVRRAILRIAFLAPGVLAMVSCLVSARPVAARRNSGGGGYSQRGRRGQRPLSGVRASQEAVGVHVEHDPELARRTPGARAPGGEEGLQV